MSIKIICVREETRQSTLAHLKNYKQTKQPVKKEFSHLKEIRLENSRTGDWTTYRAIQTKQENKGR